MPPNGSDDDTRKQKDVAFYSSLVGAWIETRMERDKTIIVLSAGGIGLLVGIVSTSGVESAWELTFYAVALLAFLGAILVCLWVLRRNAGNLIAWRMIGSRTRAVSARF